MRTTTKNKKALGNPAAAVAVANSPAVQKTIESKAELTKQAASALPFVIKTLFVFGILYIGYSSFTKRFKSIAYNMSSPDPSITEGQAQTRANALYEAMRGVGANFNTVITNLSGLNYNGWVRLYNAFGKRKPSVPFSDDMDLVEWLLSEFSGSELAQIRFLLPGVL